MMSILIILAVINTIVRPYKDKKANITAVLSYAANLCIAIINIFKTGLATFDCKTNCSVKTTLFWYFSFAEDLLLIYLPITALGCLASSKGLRKFIFKSKKK